MEQEPLDRSDIEQLSRAGIIPAEKREASIAAFRDQIEWRRWTTVWSGAIGAILLMVGVVFFFASNWKEMSPFWRFFVLEGALIATVVVACLRGIRTPVGQWLLAGATVFTGVLFAVHGQIYQTGADAFEVFAWWTGLSLLWVVLARFAPLWVFWLAVAETALALYIGQVFLPRESFEDPYLFLILGAVTLLALITWEWLSSREGFGWLSEGWIRITLVAVTVFWFTLLPWSWIFEFGHHGKRLDASYFFGTASWIILMIGLAFFYLVKRGHLIAFSLPILSVATILVCAIGRALLDKGPTNAGDFLLTGLAGILLFSAAAAGIIRASRYLRPESGNTES